MDNQETEDQSQQNINPSTFSVLLYLFFIFGIIVMLIVIVGGIVVDINKGVTHVCSKGGSCYDIYLKDSVSTFYLHLIFNSLKVLIIPILIGMVVKKWLDSK